MASFRSSYQRRFAWRRARNKRSQVLAMGWMRSRRPRNGGKSPPARFRSNGFNGAQRLNDLNVLNKSQLLPPDDRLQQRR